MNGLLQHLELLDAVLMIFLPLLAWLGRRVLAWVDLGWAERYLQLAGGQALRAIDAAWDAYRPAIEAARIDGEVDDEERAAARRAALAAFWAAIDLRQFTRALSATGQQLSSEAVKRAGESMVDRAITLRELQDGRMRPSSALR